MTVYEAIVWGKNQLLAAGKDDAQIAPSIFLEDILQVNAAGVFLKYHDLLTATDEKIFLQYLEQRKSSVPLAYIIGKKEFYGLPFKVNEHVLIPRPETELIVDAVADLMQAQNKIKSVLDVGTGSGALAITLKSLFPMFEVAASDISLQALALAQDNAETLNQSVQWIHSDLLGAVDMHVDLLVSNLPYIAYKDEFSLSEEVLKEPRTALFADEEGLKLYKNLIEQAHTVLNPQGYMLCEFGMGQSVAIQKIFEQNDFTVLRCIQDLSNIDRVIVAKRNLE